MIPEHVPLLVSLLYRRGIRRVVLSTGSRNAPLTIAFARHTKFELDVVFDERVAAFTALGIAQATHIPVVLVCTSGSAALNYLPALSEAHFRKVPLIVLTADRPPEWIDQYDGQTIYQENMYERYVRASIQLGPENSGTSGSLIAEITACLEKGIGSNPGPVHINLPFREPFYPVADLTFPDISNLPDSDKAAFDPIDYSLLQKTLAHRTCLLIAGQYIQSSHLNNILQNVSRQVPVITDITSNLHGTSQFITLHDLILTGAGSRMPDLSPDILLTLGHGVTSKPLKQYLRTFKPAEHWHISSEPTGIDLFQSLTRHIKADPSEFLENIKFDSGANVRYIQLWSGNQAKAQRYLQQISKMPYCELSAFHKVWGKIRQDQDIHLSNSMPVRYADLLPRPHLSADQIIYSNRGVCGIDGCTSTAIGTAKATKRQQVLFTGDIAFFYDRNAFWQQLPANFRVVLFNNAGGGIFRMISGARDQPELEKLFVGEQPLTAAHLAEEFSLNYACCESLEAIIQYWESIMHVDSGPGIMEVKTTGKEDARLYLEFKNKYKEYEAEK